MAIQFTDFSRAPILDSPGKDLFENILKGYKMEQEPQKMEQEKSARELANQFKAAEVAHQPKGYQLEDKQKELANSLQDKANQHYEEKFKNDQDLTKARIQKALQQNNPGSSQKANGDYANWLVANPNASPEERLKAYNKISGLKDEHTQTIINRSKDAVAGKAYDTLPPDERRREIGLYTGMGVDPIEGDKLLRQGIGASEYAKKNGIDIRLIDPVYAIDKENVKQLQRRRGYVAELKNLEDKVVGGMGKYQNTIFGYSLEQMADMLKGENPDEQGKVLAARALQPEIAALRLKVAGANIGIEAINELKSKSLGDLNIIKGLVDTPTYLAMQKYMTEYLQEASQAYEDTLNDYNRLGGHQWLKTKEQKAASKESNSGSTSFGHEDEYYDLATHKWMKK